VLPVVARRWVLTDNTFWHAQWDLIDYFIDYIDYFLQLHQLQPTAFFFFGYIDFCCQDAEREPDYL
jgi:hypothetical protein